MARLRVQEAVVDRFWANYSFDPDLRQSLLNTLEDQSRWAMQCGLAKPGRLPRYLDHIHFAALEAVKPNRISVVR